MRGISKEMWLRSTDRGLCAVLVLVLAATSVRAAEPSWIVGDVTFTGNRAFSEKTLLKQMVMRPSRLLDKVSFSRSALEDDIEELNSFYRNGGFLDVQIRLENVEMDSVRHRVRMTIAIQERERTFVAGVVVFGNRAFPDSLILSLVRTKVGQPLISRRINEDVRRILDYMTERGYLEAQVSPEIRIDREDHRAFVEFTVKEGAQIHVSEVEIVGLERVRPRAVTRELQFVRGQVLSMSAIRESMRRLYRTGLFRTVEIRPVLRDSTEGAERAVVVQVGEVDFGQVEAGIGYGTLDRIRASLGASYGNVFGLGQKVGVRGRASFVTRKGEIAFSDPWALGLPAQVDVSGYYEHHDEPSYEAIFRGMRFTVGAQVRRRTMLRLSLRWEDVDWRKLMGAPPRDVRAKNTHSLTASYAFDARNDLFNPTKGTYSLFEMEVAGLGGAGTNQFVKVTSEWRGYRPWRSGSYLSSALRTGWVREYGESKEVPIQERFFAGGSRTLRGFGEKEAGPLTEEGIPRGGRFLLVINLLEWRFPLYKMIAGAVFAEAGNVWEDWRRVGLRQVRWVAGLGVRANSPLGVVRLDFGFKLDRRPGESIGAVLVDIGQAF